MSSGKSRMIKIEKAVINMGVGEGGEKLMKAEKVMGMLTNRKSVRTISRTTNKDLGLREGMPIGCKVTLRGEEAESFIKRAFWVKENRIANYSFDKEGNFSFGVSDYTDFEGMRYDPNIGIFGLDVSVTLSRQGKRIASRRRQPRRLPVKQRINQEEGKNFVMNKFKIEVIS